MKSKKPKILIFLIFDNFPQRGGRRGMASAKARNGVGRIKVIQKNNKIVYYQ